MKLAALPVISLTLLSATPAVAQVPPQPHFGVDGARGMLVWDAKSDAVWNSNNVPSPSLSDWQKLGAIIGSERTFSSTYDARLNGDGLPHGQSSQVFLGPVLVISRLTPKRIYVFNVS
ncbi:MAG TPA: hypothetical protein VF334_10190 [Polyangia bacterium]